MKAVVLDSESYMPFIGVECTEEEMARVVHTTTHSEMFRHHDKFGACCTHAQTTARLHSSFYKINQKTIIYMYVCM